MRAHRQVLLQQFEQATQPAAVLHLAIITLVAFRKEFILNIPPSLLNDALRALRDSVDVSVLEVLEPLSEKINVESVKSVVMSNLKKKEKK